MSAPTRLRVLPHAHHEAGPSGPPRRHIATEHTIRSTRWSIHRFTEIYVEKGAGQTLWVVRFFISTRHTSTSLQCRTLLQLPEPHKRTRYRRKATQCPPGHKNKQRMRRYIPGAFLAAQPDMTRRAKTNGATKYSVFLTKRPRHTATATPTNNHKKTQCTPRRPGGVAHAFTSTKYPGQHPERQPRTNLEPSLRQKRRLPFSGKRG